MLLEGNARVVASGCCKMVLKGKARVAVPVVSKRRREIYISLEHTMLD